jgi:hypothetical protein
MAEGKIGRFYADRAKRKVDGISLKRSLGARAAAVSQTPYWQVRRRIGRWRRHLAMSMERGAAVSPAEQGVSQPNLH